MSSFISDFIYNTQGEGNLCVFRGDFSQAQPIKFPAKTGKVVGNELSFSIPEGVWYVTQPYLLPAPKGTEYWELLLMDSTKALTPFSIQNSSFKLKHDIHIRLVRSEDDFLRNYITDILKSQSELKLVVERSFKEAQ